MAPGEKHEILHHYLAALAYRTQKALRGAPPGFGSFEAGHGIRPPHEIVKHMSDVLNHACQCFGDERGRLEPLPTFEEEIARFHDILESLGEHLAAGKTPDEDTPPAGASLERLLQGPFADAMTHAGQLAMLRRMAGSPVAPESFMAAAIDRANLTANQPKPVKPLER
ncbi:MAG: hypothetical protein HKN20_12030 [Gemmatimonadetes bacterium]|nr:hypothetical protein [Gemmatimonadota bacterium]